MPIGTLSPEDNPAKSCDVANKPYRVRIQTAPSHFTGFKCIFGYRVVLGEGGEQWLSFKSDLYSKENVCCLQMLAFPLKYRFFSWLVCYGAFQLFLTIWLYTFHVFSEVWHREDFYFELQLIKNFQLPVICLSIFVSVIYLSIYYLSIIYIHIIIVICLLFSTMYFLSCWITKKRIHYFYVT